MCNAHFILRKLVRSHLWGEEDLEGFCEALKSRKVHGRVEALKKRERKHEDAFVIHSIVAGILSSLFL